MGIRVEKQLTPEWESEVTVYVAYGDVDSPERVVGGRDELQEIIDPRFSTDAEDYAVAVSKKRQSTTGSGVYVEERVGEYEDLEDLIGVQNPMMNGAVVDQEAYDQVVAEWQANAPTEWGPSYSPTKSMAPEQYAAPGNNLWIRACDTADQLTRFKQIRANASNHEQEPYRQ